MRICILTGAGISAPSGLHTYTGEGGMWNDLELVKKFSSVESLQGDFKSFLVHYNRLWQRVRAARPNLAHMVLAELAKHHDVTIITQNIDDLHEKAGCKKCHSYSW